MWEKITFGRGEYMIPLRGVNATGKTLREKVELNMIASGAEIACLLYMCS